MRTTHDKIIIVSTGYVADVHECEYVRLDDAQLEAVLDGTSTVRGTTPLTRERVEDAARRIGLDDTTITALVLAL